MDGATWRPRLAAKARLKLDQVSGQEMLLFPEAALMLNETGAAIVRLCDGERSVEAIAGALAQRFAARDPRTIGDEVNAFLKTIRERGLIE
jgi:pyrroloquinoline quinone biosynthesis protein D